MQKIVKCYVNDIAVKSRNQEDHVKEVRTIFNLVKAYQLKVNPTKTFLGVSSGKFLSFVVTSKYLLDPDKVKAI